MLPFSPCCTVSSVCHEWHDSAAVPRRWSVLTGQIPCSRLQSLFQAVRCIPRWVCGTSNSAQLKMRKLFNSEICSYGYCSSLGCPDPFSCARSESERGSLPLWVPRDTSTVPLTLCYAPIFFNSLYPICEVCIRESNAPSSYSANFGLEFIPEKLE